MSHPEPSVTHHLPPLTTSSAASVVAALIRASTVLIFAAFVLTTGDSATASQGLPNSLALGLESAAHLATLCAFQIREIVGEPGRQATPKSRLRLPGVPFGGSCRRTVSSSRAQLVDRGMGLVCRTRLA